MQIIQSPILKKFTNLSHGFTTKDGGISSAPYERLNLAFHVGDDEESVQKNHLSLAQKLEYDKKTLIHMKQIHSNRVHIVNEDDDFTTPPICDALITNRVETPLMVMVADCSPILFHDDKRGVIAVAHAGREGTFQNIILAVLQNFRENFHSNLDNITVSIGPAIQVCCYEVGNEIFEKAKELDLEYAIEKRGDSFYLNIALILKTQLLNAGIKEKNIEILQECSCCKKEKYFSYRADGITGRFCGVIKLD